MHFDELNFCDICGARMQGLIRTPDGEFDWHCLSTNAKAQAPIIFINKHKPLHASIINERPYDYILFLQSKAKHIERMKEHGHHDWSV